MFRFSIEFLRGIRRKRSDTNKSNRIDCLFSFVLGAAPEEKFPVMVWFHPGDFHWGAPVYWDASVLAARHKVRKRERSIRTSHPVVVHTRRQGRKVPRSVHIFTCHVGGICGSLRSTNGGRVTDPHTFVTTDMSSDCNIIDNLRIPVTEEENSRNRNKSHDSMQTIF